MRTRVTPAVLVLAVLALTGCARGVDFGADPGQTYAVNVVNTQRHAMIVSFDDGTGTQLLGTVPANGTERFVVAGADSPSVTIVAHDEERRDTIRRSVSLVSGETVEVRL